VGTDPPASERIRRAARLSFLLYIQDTEETHMSYLFNEAKPFANNTSVGKCKGVLLTNTTGSGVLADLWTYGDLGTTAATRVSITGNSTEIFHIRVWGISFGAGLTGAVLA
jgi:hypothetical protein